MGGEERGERGREGGGREGGRKIVGHYDVFGFWLNSS